MLSAKHEWITWADLKVAKIYTNLWKEWERELKSVNSTNFQENWRLKWRNKSRICSSPEPSHGSLSNTLLSKYDRDLCPPQTGHLPGVQSDTGARVAEMTYSRKVRSGRHLEPASPLARCVGSRPVSVVSLHLQELVQSWRKGVTKLGYRICGLSWQISEAERQQAKKWTARAWAQGTVRAQTVLMTGPGYKRHERILDQLSSSFLPQGPLHSSKLLTKPKKHNPLK